MPPGGSGHSGHRKTPSEAGYRTRGGLCIETPRLYLDDILEAITQIREYTSTMDYDPFSRDRKTQDAVARNLEIIGEVAGPLAGIHKDECNRH
jgi:hypothetical protein